MNQNATFKYQCISYLVNYGAEIISVLINEPSAFVTEAFLQNMTAQKRDKMTKILIIFLSHSESFIFFIIFYVWIYLISYNSINV